MTIPPNQREARDIVTLVELIALDPDPMPAEHMDSIVAAGRAVAGYVRRAKLGQDQPAAKPRQAPRPKRDPAELKASKAVVRARSRGFCEVNALGCTGRAIHAHHKRRRSQGGTDAPENLAHTCRSCHNFIHSNPAWSFERGWLLHALPVTTA